MKIGELLKRAREEKGLSLEEVSHATLIMKHYLEKIEAGNFSRYDGYIAAYIRKYGNYLGLDGEILMNQYREMFSAEEQEKPRRKSYKLFIVAVSLAVVLAIVALWYFKPFNKGVADRPSNTEQVIVDQETNEPTRENESTNETAEEENPPVQEVEKKVELVLSASGRCWLGIEIDGVYSQRFINKGEKLSFAGKEYIKIRYGNAKVVSVVLNGKDLGVVDTKNVVVEKIYKP